MRHLLFLSSLLPLFVFCSASNLVAGAEYNVTLGSIFEIKASDVGFDRFEKKPKVYVLDGSKKKNIKVSNVTSETLTCEFKIKLQTGCYGVWVQSGNDSLAVLASDSFYVVAPKFVPACETKPGEKVDGADPAWGKPGDTVTLTGHYFGTAKPKLWLQYQDPTTPSRDITLACRVISNQVKNPTTGESELTFSVPKGAAGIVPTIHVKNALAEGTTIFCGFEFKKTDAIETPTRDGVTLRGNLYSPADEAPHPVLIFRTPYSKDEGDVDNERTFRNAVKRGYHVLVQDVRGRYASNGEFSPYKSEGRDGYDTIEWAAAQPWSTGDIGTFGLSYPGAVQWLAAIESPPHLKAMVPAMCFSTLRQFIYFGGVFEIAWSSWAYKSMSPDIRVKKGLSGPDTCEKASRFYDKLGANTIQCWLPTSDMSILKDTCAFYYEWLDHQPYDNYWDYGEIRGNYDKVGAAVLNLSGWYDEPYGSEGASTNFSGLVAARQGQEDARTKLIIGPWTHGVASTATPEAGVRKFSTNSRIDYDAVILDWMDRHVKGIENNVLTWSPVNVYLMGDDVWRGSAAWPLTGTVRTPLYLVPLSPESHWGTLAWSQPSTTSTSSFTADPMSVYLDEKGTNFGAYDLSALSNRSDVLTFDGAPMQEDLVVAGPISAEIYLSSDAPDCDLFVKLLDVDSKGTAFNLMSPGQEVLRASYRDQTVERKLLTSGEVVKLSFDNLRTGTVFKKEHHLRVCLTASWSPIYARNLQTGALETSSSETRTATITIHHDAAHPSRLILPVLGK